MQKPVFNGVITPEMIAAAQSDGLPQIAGLQVIAFVRGMNSGVAAVNWYHLEDGTEAILDDQGNATEWPQ